MRITRISYILTTKNVPMEYIARQIAIQPHSIQTEFPPQSIADPWWSIEVSSDSASIEEPLVQLIDIILPKLRIIKDLISEYSILSTISIFVRADYEERPEISISPSFYSVFEQLNAELVFDIAYEW